MEPSFYTLSSISSSSGSDSTGNKPLTPPSPSPTTHDTSRSGFHISSISSFAENLQDAAINAFPNRGRSRYHTVNVCLIRWASDFLGIKYELDQLHDIFQNLYGFSAEIWLIPSTASQIKLTTMACNFLEKWDAGGNLFIVYYGGHGRINEARQNQWWCDSTPDSPFVDWSAIQTLFNSAISDVLILIDCCAAASSASTSSLRTSGTIETIAACGFEARAPPPGPYSFTHTLIEVLTEWAHKPSFSAAMLHTEILFVLKQKRPEKGRDGRRLEWCSTPVHWVYTSNHKVAGISISSLRRRIAVGKSVARESKPRFTTYIDAIELDLDLNGNSTGTPDENPLTTTRPNCDYRVPHVLISIALEETPDASDTTACRRWLADFPALVRYASVEGVYKGYSTLLILSVPVMVWDLLPDNPACSFVGYTVSPNMYTKSTEMYTRGRSFSRFKGMGKTRDLEQDSSYGSEFEWEGNSSTAPAPNHNTSTSTLTPEIDTFSETISNLDFVTSNNPNDFDEKIHTNASSSPKPIRRAKSPSLWMLEQERALEIQEEGVGLQKEDESSYEARMKRSPQRNVGVEWSLNTDGNRDRRKGYESELGSSWETCRNVSSF